MSLLDEAMFGSSGYIRQIPCNCCATLTMRLHFRPKPSLTAQMIPKHGELTSRSAIRASTFEALSTQIMEQNNRLSLTTFFSVFTPLPPSSVFFNVSPFIGLHPLSTPAIILFGLSSSPGIESRSHTLVFSSIQRSSTLLLFSASPFSVAD